MSGFDLNHALFLDGVLIPGPGSTGSIGSVPIAGKRAVNFNGSNTVLYRSAALVSAAASSQYLFSVWFKSANASAFFRAFLLMLGLNGDALPDEASANSQLWGTQTVHGWNVYLQDTTNANDDAYAYETGNHFDGAWHNIIFTGNTNFAAGSRTQQVVFDGVLVSVTDVGAAGLAFAIDFTFPGVVIGSQGFTGTDPQGLYAVDMAEMYINTAETLDMTIGGNIAKFYNGFGLPADLGADGSAPTGSPPAFYLSLGTFDTPDQFAQDRSGNGNNFTIGGSLTRAMTDPF